MTQHFPQLARVQHGRGSHIEPELDPAWPDLTKLQWHAAVIYADTGIHVTVSVSNTTRRGKPVPGLYCLHGNGFSCSPYSYDGAWSFLSGVGVAGELARLSTVPRTQSPTEDPW